MILKIKIKRKQTKKSLILKIFKNKKNQNKKNKKKKKKQMNMMISLITQVVLNNQKAKKVIKKIFSQKLIKILKKQLLKNYIIYKTGK